MTLLSVVKDVCAVVGVTVPTSVTLNITANRTMQEMLALANEMAQRIAYDTREWTKMLGAVKQPGDGIADGFNLPANFKRMLLRTEVYRLSTPLLPMRFVPDYNEWIAHQMSNTVDPRGEWIVVGGKIYVTPRLSATDFIHYTYLHSGCVLLNTSGGFGDSFTDDLDSFRLDERLLKLGMVWQWKANKGTSYAEDMGTYSDALAIAMGHDKPMPIYAGRRSIPGNVSPSYPFPVPTP
jgi:hypothetical protein